MAYFTYDVNTGEIVQTFTGAASLMEMSDQGTGGLIVADGEADSATEYMVDHVKTPRPSLVPVQTTIIGDDEDTILLTDLPVGTIVILGDYSKPKGHPERKVRYVIDDGSFEWSTTKLGEYSFQVYNAFPYQDQTFTVEVIE